MFLSVLELFSPAILWLKASSNNLFSKGFEVRGEEGEKSIAF